MPWGIAAAQEGVGGALQPFSGSAQLNEAHESSVPQQGSWGKQALMEGQAHG